MNSGLRKALVIGVSATIVGFGAYLVYKAVKGNGRTETVYEVTMETVRKRKEEIEGESGEEPGTEDEGVFVNPDADIEENVDDEDMHVDSVFEYISMEEYEGIVDDAHSDYDKISLTLYSDGVLMGDEDEGPLDPKETVGSEAVKLLEESPYHNVVYVRNNDLACDYEVVAVADVFGEV